MSNFQNVIEFFLVIFLNTKRAIKRYTLFKTSLLSNFWNVLKLLENLQIF